MLGGNIFFKRPAVIRNDSFVDKERGVNAVNNNSVRPFMGHSKFGFQTLLNQDSFAKLPTAPAVVGGNVDWTQSKVSPFTQFLHGAFSASGRQMKNIPTIGASLNLVEPNVNSIHTQY